MVLRLNTNIMYFQPRSPASDINNRATTPLSICSSVGSFQSDSYSPTTPEPQGLSPTPALRPLASLMDPFPARPSKENSCFRRPSLNGDDAAEIASLPPMDESGVCRRRRERSNSDVSIVSAATWFSATESPEKPSTASRPLRKKLSLQTSLEQFSTTTTPWNSSSGRDTPSSTASTLCSPRTRNLNNLRQRIDTASPTSAVSSFSASSTVYSYSPPSHTSFSTNKPRTSNVSSSDFETSSMTASKTARVRRATASALTGGRTSRASTSYSGQTAFTSSSFITHTFRNRPGYCSYNNPYQASFSLPPSLITSPVSLPSPSSPPKTADSALDPHLIFGPTSIDWKTPESRRKEYEEADRKRKGLWNWVRKRLLCGVKSGGAVNVNKVEFWEEGGREGSVRRYRLDLPPKKEGDTHEEEVDGVEWGWDGR